MPELPEVETICQGLTPLIQQLDVTDVVVRSPSLRLPISKDLASSLRGHRVLTICRRAKYLLIRFHGDLSLLLHLGMSGTLRYFTDPPPFDRHDHVDIIFGTDGLLRLRDPRRFGLILFVVGDPLNHPLLRSLGPEPLSDDFNLEYLYRSSRNRRVSVKIFLMDQATVVGVGNIYASEALYSAGIAPWRSVGGLSHSECNSLVAAIRAVLHKAISAGGTTIRDFQGVEGRPGYFSQELTVYGREGESCQRCKGIIKKMKQGGRSTFYCPECQR